MYSTNIIDYIVKQANKLVISLLGMLKVSDSTIISVSEALNKKQIVVNKASNTGFSWWTAGIILVLLSLATAVIYKLLKIKYLKK